MKFQGNAYWIPVFDLMRAPNPINIGNENIKSWTVVMVSIMITLAFRYLFCNIESWIQVTSQFHFCFRTFDEVFMSKFLTQYQKSCLNFNRYLKSGLSNHPEIQKMSSCSLNEQKVSRAQMPLFIVSKLIWIKRRRVISSPFFLEEFR